MPANQGGPPPSSLEQSQKTSVKPADISIAGDAGLLHTELQAQIFGSLSCPSDFLCIGNFQSVDILFLHYLVC